MLDALVKRTAGVLEHLGDLAQFALVMARGVFRGAGRGSWLAIFYAVGVESIPVVAITGAFIGMVLAVEIYSQFSQLGLTTRLGTMINVSVVRQLGPVLAAVMLAGRVGSAMAAELATMRTTEQTDALACLGVDPIEHLGAPRLLACVLLIPPLTILANFVGVLGGAFICIHVFGVESHYYWLNSQGAIGLWDFTAGLIKPMVFGAAIAVLCCHRGMNSEPGAEGVGRAATQAFVVSFVAILALNFFLAMLLNNLHDYLWPNGKGLL